MRRTIARISLALTLFFATLFFIAGRFTVQAKPIDGLMLSLSHASFTFRLWDTARWPLVAPRLSAADTGWRFSWKPDFHLGHTPLNPGLGDGQTFIVIPLWMPAVLFATLNLVAARRQWRDRCRCGYDLRAIPPATPCPRCGAITDRS